MAKQLPCVRETVWTVRYLLMKDKVVGEGYYRVLLVIHKSRCKLALIVHPA